MADIHCIVVTPEITAVDCQASFITLPLEDGEKGIGYNHAPLIGRLGMGELRLRLSDGTTQRYYVDGGFVQIARNTVSIMTERAVPVASLDPKALNGRLDVIRKRAVPDGEAYVAHERNLKQLRAQLRMLRDSPSSHSASHGH
jgi:F-type H+-transporting ATPase subunit epsilon